ncbi:MAG: hypothetical protein JRI59_05505 [Deltaproteobacteria bacterium]|nr:hypothetical protein [Deltaproteobacteria bacterium]
MNYLRDPDGNVYLESDNPVQAWTPEEWQAFLTEVEAEIVALREKLTSMPVCKVRPDEETLRFWNSVHGSYAAELESRLRAKTAWLEELKKV